MRVWTLLQLQWWDTRRNPLIILFALTVLLVGGVMSLMVPRGTTSGGDTLEMLSMMLVMTAYFVGWNIPTIGMAEEKEKRTLEALLLTPARPVEIMLSRALLSAMLTLSAGVLMLLIFRQMPVRPGLLAIGFLLTVLFTISGGTLIGLLSPDIKSTGSLSTPIVLLLTFATTLPWRLFLPAVWEVQAWLPTRPLAELLRAGVLGEEVPIVRDVLIMLAYTALVLWLCTRQMRRFGAARR